VDNSRYSITTLSIYCLQTVYGYFLYSVVQSFIILEDRSSIANETNVQMESIQINQQQSVSTELPRSEQVLTLVVSERRIPYLRTPSLPTYDNVMCSESSEKLETPPPKFDQISFQS